MAIDVATTVAVTIAISIEVADINRQLVFETLLPSRSDRVCEVEKEFLEHEKIKPPTRPTLKRFPTKKLSSAWVDLWNLDFDREAKNGSQPTKI